MVEPVRSNLNPTDLEALTSHLAHLDHSAALALVETARADGASVETIVTDLLAPALVEIGRRWAAGEMGAAEALAGAAIARQALPRTPVPATVVPSHRSVAVCCPPGEHHEIPAEMVTELLRAEGCPAQHIGAGVTPKHLPGFLSRQRPAALLISCTTSCGLPGAARSIEVAHAYNVPVIVGGAAFGHDALLALRLGAAAWAPTAGAVAGIVESWMSRPVQLPSARPLTEEYLMFEAGLPEIRAAAVQSLRRLAGEGNGDDPGGVADVQDRLELLLRHLGAALLVDDGRLFLDFLSWRAEYYQHRTVGPERLAHALAAVSAALGGEFGRARRFVEEGRQHVAWLVRPGDGAAPEQSGPRWSPVDDLAARARNGAGGGRDPLAPPASPALGSPATSTAAGVPGPVRPLVSVGVGSSAPPAPLRPSGAQEQWGRVFADLLFVAATTCHAPYALISVAQGDGRWSTLGHGVERRDLLADNRLYSLVGRSADPVEIPDLGAHPELGTSPLARAPLGVRFVYGIPLRTRQSALLGVLCILDRRPRELSPRERQALSAVARQVASQLAIWRRAASGQSASASPVSASPVSGPPVSGPPGSVSPATVGSEYAGVPSMASERAERRELLGISERRSLHAERDGGDELLRSHEVAVLFDVTDRTVINWAAAGKLPSIRTAGGHLRFRGVDVLALLAGHPIDGRSAAGA